MPMTKSPQTCGSLSVIQRPLWERLNRRIISIRSFNELKFVDEIQPVIGYYDSALPSVIHLVARKIGIDRYFKLSCHHIGCQKSYAGRGSTTNPLA
jgi:hypothetical protein